MRVFQKEIVLTSKSRGFHLVTNEVLHQLSELSEFKAGTLQLFIKHTSASLALNENADPTVRSDMEKYFDKYVPENESYYEHTLEGSDDMPAHIKSVLTDSSLMLPISDGHLNVGTWQGIYLCEHRNHGGARSLVATVMGI
ncbi:secondary thiamine-phosphate synthase enzyme YjbQ [Aureibacter tunicatorum]|uniref:Secondary thiamine-phosphate synthase enzyme n=1 Tax=Aureibacter tunicatorum TaxID=866807 RepID=A0AAE4BR90_9BACT|nr:secondary thiamine-phosphate synthase enzyme YjbQ [Aureibacter tunicatorum]MDR6237703.1 secondary thiamine-phosphate synthase enzyme [Aureibacter tunicatorum]BDD02738.1 hypothetical protein AUTU_02210 [Aureibacter tunicatorum]